jgi:hypothetical protein
VEGPAIGSRGPSGRTIVMCDVCLEVRGYGIEDSAWRKYVVL